MWPSRYARVGDLFWPGEFGFELAALQSHLSGQRLLIFCSEQVPDLWNHSSKGLICRFIHHPRAYDRIEVSQGYALLRVACGEQASNQLVDENEVGDQFDLAWFDQDFTLPSKNMVGPIPIRLQGFMGSPQKQT